MKDFKGFRKIGEKDGKTILKHYAGHELHIASDKLSSDLRKKLTDLPTSQEKVVSKMPQPMAEGGEPQEEGQVIASSNDQPNLKEVYSSKRPMTGGEVLRSRREYEVEKPQEGYKDGGDVEQPLNEAAANWENFIPGAVNSPGQQQIPDQPTVNVMPQPGSAQVAVQKQENGLDQVFNQYNQVRQQAGLQPLAAPSDHDPYGVQAQAGAELGGLGEVQQGATQEAQAQGQLGKAEAGVYDQGMQQQQQLYKNYQQNTSDLMNEYNAAKQDYADGHINPNHYLESMDAGNKISTAIGLILGGMGSGILHQSNPVLGFLDKQIDRDVAAQQAELGKKHNMLGVLNQQFGNINQATQMATAMRQGIMATDIRKVGAQSQDPLARARALQLAGNYDMKASQTISQLAMMQSMQQPSKPGEPAQENAPEHQLRMLQLSGRATPEDVKQAGEELKNYNNYLNQRGTILSAFDKSANASVGSRLSHIGRDLPEDAGLMAVAEPALHDALGRINEQAIKNVKSMTTGLASKVLTPEDIAKNRENFANFMDEEKGTQHPTLDRLGIQVHKPSKPVQFTPKR